MSNEPIFRDVVTTEHSLTYPGRCGPQVGSVLGMSLNGEPVLVKEWMYDEEADQTTVFVEKLVQA